jgi:uncharacterized protein (DUF697 family)
MEPPDPKPSDDIVLRHVTYAMGAAAIPIPLADVAAVSWVQYDMIEALAERFGVDVDRERARAAVLSIAGATLARLGASLVKSVPGGGWVIGGATQVLLSGASTWALGQVYCQHFESDGTLEEIDLEILRERYHAAVQRGLEIARRLRDGIGLERMEEEEADEALERLARLRRAGVITPEEYRRLVAPLADEPDPA